MAKLKTFNTGYRYSPNYPNVNSGFRYTPNYPNLSDSPNLPTDGLHKNGYFNSPETRYTPSNNANSYQNPYVYDENHKAKQMAKDYKSIDLPVSEKEDHDGRGGRGTPTMSSSSGGSSYGGYGSYGYTPMSRIKGFEPSQSYLDAMAYTNSLLEKINSGRTSYTDKINSLMDKIENREKFNYDMNDDPMFQQALASYMATGKTAMQDTMGQASALTGGYGSSYATSAANQAYNGYLQQAYDDLPQYYNMALNKYQMEGQDLYNQLGMYSDADATEYQRMFNAYQANYGQAQDMYNHEYSNFWDTTNYNTAIDEKNADLAYKYANMNSDLKYKYDKLKMDAEQYDKSLKASQKSTQDKSNASADSEEVTYKEPSTTQYEKALKAFESGGYEEFYKVLDSFNSNIDVDMLVDYVESNGNLPIDQRNYEKVGKDTFNWFGGIDNNDRVKDEYGNEYSLKELYDNLYTNYYNKLKKQMSDSQAQKEAKNQARQYVMKYNSAKKN